MATGGFKDTWGEFGEDDTPNESPEGTEHLSTARSQFSHWDEILEAVQQALVEEGENNDLQSDDFKERFFELVSGLVDRNTIWDVGNERKADLIKLLRSALFGYGPLEPLMEIKGLEDIIANKFDDVWIVVAGEKRKVEPSPFQSEREIRNFVDRIMNSQGKELNLSNPADDGTLLDGSRIQATIPPVALDGTLFTIRKFRPIPFTMREYLETGMFTEDFLVELRRMIDANFTIVVSGGTSSGKAQPHDSNILTPSGWKKIGDLEVGDEVLGSKGDTQTVYGVFPQGYKPCFEVEFENNRKTRCCDEHLWAVFEGDDTRVLTLRELMEEGLGNGKEFETPSYYDTDPLEQKRDRMIGVKEVEPCDMVCISVSNADQLYVTDDHILTHNTTFINAVGSLIPQDDRLILMEDTPELLIRTLDTVRLQTIGAGARGQKASDKNITLTELIRYALRLRPDRILIGEVRGAEAFDLLQGLNTGHSGSFTTVHADAAIMALSKLRDLAMGAEKLGERAVENIIASAVDIVIQVGRIKGQAGRRVLEARQVFHPAQLTNEGKKLLAPIVKSGDMQRTGDGANPPICSFPLFEWEGRELVKKWDMIPLAGRDIPPPDKYREDLFGDGKPV